MDHVFSGSLLECLVHYGKTLPKGKGKGMTARAAIVSCTGRSDDTVRGWLRGRSVPIGPAYIALLFFLSSRGYRVTEVEEADPIIREASKAFAYGEVTMDELMRVCGYTEAGSVYKMLMGRVGISRARRAKLLAVLGGIQTSFSFKGERTVA